MPAAAADFLSRHPDAPAALGIGVALALVLAVVVFSGRPRRAEPVVGHYTCFACRGVLAVALVRLPHERLARLACTLPECRAAYGVVADDGDAVGTLHRAHAAYMRVMTRPVPPRNAGRRKAPAEVAPTPAPVAIPAAPEDWAGFDAAPSAPWPVPLPPPARTTLVATDAPGRNRP